MRNMKKEINDLQDKSINGEYSIFSIDPKGSKDLDDAFHYKKEEEYFEIGIHIACPYYFLNTPYYFRGMFLKTKQLFIIIKMYICFMNIIVIIYVH